MTSLDANLLMAQLQQIDAMAYGMAPQIGQLNADRVLSSDSLNALAGLQFHIGVLQRQVMAARDASKQRTAA